MGDGDINLIAKVAPYNDGFVGMVNADQVIGASGAGGYLPSSTISGNSLQEYQLKISNSPSDGYFLQYKDSTDKLTWAETSTTDVAWSGASEFYPVSSLVHVLNIWYSNSSNKYSKAYISTSTGVFALSTHSHDEFGLWSGASEYTSVSSNVNTLLNWYSNSSSKLSNAFASAAIALYSETYSSEDDLTSILNDNYANSGAFHSHITNEDNPHNVVWADVETGAKDDLADDYYPSSLGNSLSDSFTSHTGDSSIHFTKSSIDDDYAGSGAFQTHKNDSDIHFPSSSITNWLDSVYQQSGSTGFDSSWSGATGFYGFSSNTKLNITSLFSASSSFDSRLDDLEDNDEFLHENYITSSNAINRFVESGGTKWTDLTDGGETDLHTHAGMTTDVAWSGAIEFYAFSSNVKTDITNLYNTSSSLNSRIETLEGNDVFDPELYITSTSAIDRFADSSNVASQLTSLFGWSSNALNLYGASSHTHDDRYFTETEITTNYYNKTFIDSLSGSIDSRLDSLEGQELTSWSGASSYNSFSSNTTLNITSLFDTSSALDSRIDTLEGYDEFVHENYITSSNSISRFADSSSIQTKLGNKQDTLTGSEFYPSSLGHSLSGSYHDHISDTSIHYSKDSISIEDISDVAVMTPTDGKALIWDDTQSKWSSQTVSSSDVAWSGASSFYGFSSNAQSLYHPSGLVISGQEYSQAYASAQRVKDLFDSTLYSLSSNLYNQTWIDSLSGSINSRLEDLEDNVEFLPENYITSSSAIARFTDSSNLNRTYVDTVSGNLSDRIDAIDDTPNTWGVLTAGTGIDTLTNVGVSGAGETITVLGYSTISSQAKQAYDFSSASDLFNHEDYIYSSTAISRFADSSSIQTKFIISGGIHNAFSSQSISSNLIRITDIYISDWDLNSANDHTVRDWFRLVQSPGWLSGGALYLVSTNTNTNPDTLYICVSGGQGILRGEDNDFAKLYFVDFPTSSMVPITASSPKEYGICYNSGTPKVKFESPGYAWDLDTEVPLGLIVNRSGSYCELQNPWSVRDPITNIIERIQAFGYISRDETQGGLILGESGDNNRYITLTAGKLWARLNEYDISEIDTDPGGGGDTFVVFIRKAGGGYTVMTQDETQWDNNHYDNNGTLVEVGNNDYGVLWFYLTTNGDLNMIYHDSEYNTASQAENASPPSSLPTCLEYGGILLGRLIFEGTADVAIEVQSAFDITFTAAQAADHGNLTGLNDDDHTQYHNNTRGDARYYTQAQVTTISGSIVTHVKNNYYPSSLGHSLMDYSSNAKTLYPASSLVNKTYLDNISSATLANTNFSSAAVGLYHPSGYVISGAQYSQAYISTSTGVFALASHTHDDRYYTETEIDNNFYTQTWIDILSGSIDSRIDALEGASEITWLSLTTLSSNATDAYNWVNASSQRYESILASGSEYSTNYTWYNTNHDGLDSLLASGNKYSQAYASTSTGIFALATHSHTTFGLWSGASAFYGFSSNSKEMYHPSGYGTFNYISSQNISGGSFTSANFNVIANTISGLIDPIWPSAATNKHYVDTISGALDSKINAVGGLTGDTVSSNFFLKTSGQTLWDWYYTSGVNLYDISTNLDAKIDGKEDSLDGSEYYPSGLGNAKFTDLFNFSSNAHSLYYPSSTTRYGWAYVVDEGTIVHNCGNKPSWVTVSPSGASPLVYSFKVDDTNITVYHSSPTSESFSWRAII